MLNDEEKKAIEVLNYIKNKTPFIFWYEDKPYNRKETINTILNLIEKKSKEIEELKEDRKSYAEEYIHNNPWLYKQLNEVYIFRTESKQKEKQAYNFGYRNGCNDTSKFNDKTFIRIDKLKEILGIEETDDEKILSLLQTLVDENARLEDIEDKKVQIEYNNVFNKGVKSVEDKIKAKIEEIDFMIKEINQGHLQKYTVGELLGAKRFLESLLEKE